MYRVFVAVLCVMLGVPLQALAADLVVLDAPFPTNVVFSEFMANPLDESTGEFVELYNASEVAVDLNGWALSDLVDIKDTIKDYIGTFDLGASGTILTPHAYALIVDPDYAGQYNDPIEAHADLATLLLVTVDDTTLGNGLGNTSDTLNVKSSDSVFQISHAWTTDAGNGFSWAGYGLGSPIETWKKSAQIEGATPGFSNNMSPQAALLKTHEEGISPLAVSFDAGESVDPEGLPLSFAMDFGNGESAALQTAPTFVHTYSQVGVYTATLTVQDSEGAASVTQATVQVNPKIEATPCVLAVTEVLPNPAGSDTADEFIEIQNKGTAPCSLGAYSIDDVDGGSVPFAIPDSQLLPGAYTALYSGTTHITLNNTGDSARILDSLGHEISNVTYTNSKENQSYALNGSSFSWTTTLTPNATNVFTQEQPPQDDPKDPSPKTEPEQDDAISLSAIHAAKKLEKDDDVMVEGYVIAKAGTLSSQYLYIHDGTGGIQIYSSKKLFPAVKIGQKVRVTGTISKTANLTRVLTHTKEDVEVLSGAKTMKAISKKTGKISIADEGELITVTGKIEKKLGTSAVINDGSGSLVVSFRDGSGLKASSVATGATTTLQGIVVVSNDKVELLPRGLSDILTTSTLASSKSTTLPKAGADIGVVLLFSLVLGSAFFGIFQLFRARSSSTRLSASTKNSGTIFGATISSLESNKETSPGEILPIKRS